MFAYSGTLSGGTANFLVTAAGVTRTLTNLTTTTPPEIAVIVTPTVRGAKPVLGRRWRGQRLGSDHQQLG